MLAASWTRGGRSLSYCHQRDDRLCLKISSTNRYQLCVSLGMCVFESMTCHYSPSFHWYQTATLSISTSKIFSPSYFQNTTFIAVCSRLKLTAILTSISFHPYIQDVTEALWSFGKDHLKNIKFATVEFSQCFVYHQKIWLASCGSAFSEAEDALEMLPNSPALFEPHL